MEHEETSDNISQKGRKHKVKLQDEGPKTKKARLFSIKDFRKNLHSSEKLNALKEFLSTINQSTGHDYVFDYLKNGGNCLELLQTLESDSAIPPTLVFELVTQLLLRINAAYGQFYSSAHESCRYLINNYLPLLHKMLGMSSSKDERKACLKLLTAMATFSPNLAKDILINVKFHSANIELLTKHTGEANSVRDCFVHFLTAFLVDSDLHTLSILLEKGGLLTGIISGLQYDAADTVCIVIAAMKNHILQNNAVMKTTKMHVFNTSVVKDIVNLYNWKGPDGLKALDKNNKTVFEVDKIEKSKVSECVHDFLLVLCTSHKHGVIFRDHSVGLGKKNQNGLMYTVLDSLDRPWEHSYASELVIKICRSCPDLTKNLWSILKPFLEPRLTEKWLNAINFARKLIKELEPSCIEYCVKDLNPHQLAQIIEFLVSPSPILKIILNTGNATDETPELGQHILIFLCDTLERIRCYLNFVERFTSTENYVKIKQYLSNYITKNYPDAQILLNNWKNIYLKEHGDKEPKASNHVYLKTTLSILNLYKSITPQLLHSLSSNSLNLKEILKNLTSQSEDETEKTETLQMNIISIFVDIDHSSFLPKTEIFCYIISLLFKMYHKEKSEEIRAVWYKILKHSGIFDGSFYEINIWLNGIFNFSGSAEDFAEDFVNIIRNTSEHVVEYQKEFAQMSVEENSEHPEDFFIDTLLDISEESDDASPKVKHKHLSPLVLGLLKHLQENKASKNMKKYSEFVLLNIFHSQTTLPKFASLIQNYSEHVPANIFNYVQSWARGSCESLTKLKGALEVFKTLSQSFLSGNSIDDLLDGAWYPGFLEDALQLSTFYLSNLVAFNSVSGSHLKSWTASIDFLISRGVLKDKHLEIILENPSLIKHFNIIHFDKVTTASGICTSAIIEAIEKLGKLNIINIEPYTKMYSRSVFKSLIRILAKPKKYLNNQNITKILELCPLAYKDCVTIMNKTSDLLIDNFELADNSVLLDILAYCLNRVLFLCNQNFDLKPIEAPLILRITSHVTTLNKENKNAKSLTRPLKSYLEAFPHSLAHVDAGLFLSILQLKEYDSDGAELAVLMLSKNLKMAKEIEANIVNVVEKKGLVLPLVEVLVESSKNSEDLLKSIYVKLEASILKAMQKPQKVGQHFLKNYNIGPLVEKFMPLDKCKVFADKAQKFEVVELFHVKLLEACYTRIMGESEINEKQACSVIMTFVHLEIALFKKTTGADEDTVKIHEVSTVFDGLLEKLALKISPGKGLTQVANNETFKTFCKFALKYGVSGQHTLVKLLRRLIGLLKDTLEKDQADLLLKMLLSHSEFLNVVLGERCETKLEVLSLFLVICQHWNEVMEKGHMAVILSAYRGMVTRCDRTVLALLKLYESKAEQTRFYDFKPYLWGRAAATHYSVRTQIESSLIRQPKISDVLGIIKEDLVNLTITNHPLKDNLHQEVECQMEDLQCYDLKFLLPLFSHILAPEQQVKTYVFSRSGALSLTIAGLSSQDKEVRQAACHVLSRFHFHLEARQTGKDNLLWIRFVEALCKGAAVLPDFKLNNFASIFYARMALVLTNPRHVMYTPLSSYLTAKEDLDISTVPELYTLLFSSDVNYKEHRNFILEILRDGLRTEKDLVDFLKSMGFKLFSELFSSCLADVDSKLLMLDILLAACKLSLGVNILCENNSLLSQLHTLAMNVFSENKSRTIILPRLLPIFLEIVKIRTDLFTNQLVFDVFVHILRSDNFLSLKNLDYECFYEVVYTIYSNNSGIFRNKDVFVSTLLDRSNDKFCNYIKKFGCKFIDVRSPSLQVTNKNYFLRLLIFKLLA